MDGSWDHRASGWAPSSSSSSSSSVENHGVLTAPEFSSSSLPWGAAGSYPRRVPRAFRRTNPTTTPKSAVASHRSVRSRTKSRAATALFAAVSLLKDAAAIDRSSNPAFRPALEPEVVGHEDEDVRRRNSPREYTERGLGLDDSGRRDWLDGVRPHSSTLQNTSNSTFEDVRNTDWTNLHGVYEGRGRSSQYIHEGRPGGVRHVLR